ncbi:MAG TPA: hypothetical protein VM054_11255 [bacterium]|nr:hypothetical protein [bacterium]
MSEELNPPKTRRARLRRVFCILVLAGVTLTFAGCAAGNVEHFNGDSPADFWAGLWHGFILLFSFIISLFTDTVKVYEAANVGWAYDLGFLLGVIIFWRGNGEIIRTRRWKKKE